MGADQSTSHQPSQEPLTKVEPQATPICVTEARFCFPTNILWYLNASKNEPDFYFTDANSRRVVHLQCNGRDQSCCSLDRDKNKYLRNDANDLVLYMKRNLSSLNERFYIFADALGAKPICKLRGHTAFMKLKMSTELTDTNGVRQELWMIGDIFSTFTVYLGEPKHGGVVIARMIPLRSDFWKAEEFTVEIAANVDIAPIAMFCIAAEQHCRDRRKAMKKNQTLNTIRLCL